MDVVVNMKL